MPHRSETRKLPYRARQMYDLVADVESYPQFLPWNSAARIRSRSTRPDGAEVIEADLVISFKVFREVYLLTGEYPVESLYMLQHFMNNTFKALDYQKLSAAAVLMSVVMVGIIALLFIFEDKLGKDVEG